MDTTTPPPDQPGQPASEPPRPPDGPRVTSEQMRDLGRLRRSVHDRHVAGVAGGLARHLDIDPIIVRVALVVLVFFGGSGLLLYAAGWLLVPEEGTDDQPLGLDERSRRVALIGAGVLAALAAVGDWAGAFWFPWPVVVIALVVLWFVNRNQQRTGGGVPSATSPASPATAATVGYPTTGYGSPEDPATRYAAHDPAAYARPRKPRKRGPVLFWATLAMIAIGIGTLGVIEGAGNEVPDSAYPALAMAITGVMLVVGAFWGRAGGLILVGLVAAVATAAGTASQDIEGSRLSYTPLQASEVRDSYDVATGDLTLDLSRIADVEDLDGRDVSIDGGVGTLEVVVPDGVDVAVDASTGVGAVDLLGRETGGFGVQEDGFVDGGAGAPQMTIEVDLGIGQVTVREQ